MMAALYSNSVEIINAVGLVMNSQMCQICLLPKFCANTVHLLIVRYSNKTFNCLFSTTDHESWRYSTGKLYSDDITYCKPRPLTVTGNAMEDGYTKEETIGEIFLNAEQHDCRQEVICISTSCAK